jgi:hypothetical protein
MVAFSVHVGSWGVSNHVTAESGELALRGDILPARFRVRPFLQPDPAAFRTGFA